MSIENKLTRIESLRASINELKPSANWDDDFYRKVKFDFTYASNKIEGNTLTYGQTIKLLKDFVTPQNASSGDLLDMINHQKILDHVFLNYRSQKLSEENIQELHAELMKNIDQWADDGSYNPGRYKQFENMTVRSTGKIHTYLLPDQVPDAMKEMIYRTNELLKKVNPQDTDAHALTVATYFHQEFLNRIHPFSDGNGRIARLLVNLILLKSGYPPIFIKEINKDEYLKRFELSDNDPGPMMDFMADRLIESLEEKLKFITSQKSDS